MRARTAVILCIAGAVLTFAVSGHPASVDIRIVGVILMLTGAAGLWPYGGRTWLLLAGWWLRRCVDEAAPAEGVRVPLEELLAHSDGSGCHVWAAQPGHEGEVTVRDRPGGQEVARNDTATER